MRNSESIGRDVILCRLCRTEQRPIKAHIIPEGFFRALRDDSGVPEIRTFSESAAISDDDGAAIAVSLLWRASVFTQQFYQRVDLKPFEEQMRDMILNENPGDLETFSVALGRFADPRYRGIFDPHRERFGGTNYIRFYLAGFVAHLKVDRRPTPEPLSSLIMRPGSPIVVVSRSRYGRDAEAMRNIARTSATWKRDLLRRASPGG